MATVDPGEVFFDRLDGGLYEKCVLQPTTADTPDRHKAARGGTGIYYRAIGDGVLRALLAAPKGSPESARLDEAVMIFDLTEGFIPKMVFLEILGEAAGKPL